MSKGYGKQNGLRIIVWNKGPAYFINKIEEITQLLSDKKNPYSCFIRNPNSHRGH